MTLRARFSKSLRGILFVGLGLCAADSLGERSHSPGWMREPALSPDGQSIAFRSDGDLYVASVRTGRSRLLRGSPSHEMTPIWLPDGKTIAYADDVHGSYDVFTVPADGGGEPKRLTFHSLDEIPIGVAANGTDLLIRSGRLDLYSGHAVYPYQREERASIEWTGVFSLPVAGGMPQPLLEPASLEATMVDADGRLLFSKRPGRERIFRKHERSPAAWDIWLRERDGTTFRKLTEFTGHDTTPVWNPADNSIYYLSERSGSMNVWRMPFEGDVRAEAVTSHTRFPVSGLTIARDGTIAYSWRGKLYAGTASRGFAAIPVRMPKRPLPETKPASLDLTGAVREVALAGSHQAIVIARGEVFAIDTSSGAHHALLSGEAGAKSSPTLSADGRTLLVACDRGGVTELLLAKLPPSAQSWTDSRARPKVIALARTQEVILNASLSPDARKAAFTTSRALKLVDTGSGEIRVALTREAGLGRQGQRTTWHPASRHLALEFSNLQRPESEVAVLDSETLDIVNVTRSGFDDKAPFWSADGRSLIWQNDREGLRTFQVLDGAGDVYALVFDPEAWRARAVERGPMGVATGEELSRWLKELQSDPLLLNERRLRLTPLSSDIRSTALAPSGRFLLWTQKVGKHMELWRKPLPEGAGFRVAQLPESASVSDSFRSIDSIGVAADEREAIVLAGGTVLAVQLQATPVKITALELKDIPRGQGAVERTLVFEHVVRAASEIYYRPEYLANIDWPGYAAEYRRWLPAVTHPKDFAELMQELFGELNASHTEFLYLPSTTAQTGALGAIYDPRYQGAGVRIAEVLRSSPLANAEVAPRAGDVITSIDGRSVPAGADPAEFLLDRLGKKVEITLLSAEGVERRLSVSPISDVEESALFYQRWVAHRRLETERLSGGRLGYVHLAWMEDDAFSQMVDSVLGEYATKQGIVLDTRFNVGGWMHGPMMSFYSARFAFSLRANGVEFAKEPSMRAGRPFVVLINSSNYSNGFETPRLLKEAGLAKLVGAPIPGTGLGGSGYTLPYWEYHYNVAWDASMTADGRHWENETLQPDVLVEEPPAAPGQNQDPQLESAINLLLQQLDRATPIPH
jgi:Tol biopolymer transport system component/C-terminal processing protease CtpA/Prc